MCVTTPARVVVWLALYVCMDGTGSSSRARPGSEQGQGRPMTVGRRKR